MECSICFETLEDGNKYTTKCNHVFHLNCIKDLKECPLCREYSFKIIADKRREYASSFNTIIEGYQFGYMVPKPKQLIVKTYKTRIRAIQQSGFLLDFDDDFLCLGIYSGSGATCYSKLYYTMGDKIFFPTHILDVYDAGDDNGDYFNSRLYRKIDQWYAQYTDDEKKLGHGYHLKIKWENYNTCKIVGQRY